MNNRIATAFASQFSAADSSVADAELTPDEFARSVDVEELKKTLAPIGGLHVGWLYKLKGDRQVQSAAVFKVLDKDVDGVVTVRYSRVRH